MFKLNHISTSAFHDPEHYVMPGEDLIEAVNTAILLGKPLLLTGAPGTGKTELARKVAHELSKKPVEELKGFAPFLKDPFVFNTKTTSAATDLFYNYDAVRDFQSRTIKQVGVDPTKNNEPCVNAGQEAKSPTAHPYIRLNALGKAIVQSMGSKAIAENNQLKDLASLDGFHEHIKQEPHSSVVLIDEIDKAPRDFPNDLLNEIERMEFRITELDKEIKKQIDQKPLASVVVILTSNFEKNLPDAFLRRCLFFHIASPDEKMLCQIVATRMGAFLAQQQQKTDEEVLKQKFNQINKAINEFTLQRDKFNGKKPTTSELLEWIRILELHGFFDAPVDFKQLKPEQRTVLQYSLPILTKTREDLENMRKEYIAPEMR